MTTILANFVGSSVVSAITHTPASGPFALVTTPPMSSGSIATVALGCCARTQGNEATSRLATAIELTSRIYTPIHVLLQTRLFRRGAIARVLLTSAPALMLAQMYVGNVRASVIWSARALSAPRTSFLPAPTRSAGPARDRAFAPSRNRWPLAVTS